MINKDANTVQIKNACCSMIVADSICISFNKTITIGYINKNIIIAYSSIRILHLAHICLVFECISFVFNAETLCCLAVCTMIFEP